MSTDGTNENIVESASIRRINNPIIHEACGHQTMAECSQQQDNSISLPIIVECVSSMAEAARDEESEEKEEEETCSSEEADHAMPMRKIRPTLNNNNNNAMGGENTVGAIQINERAPQINRRFFMGLDRPGARQRRTEDRAARRAAARQGSTPPTVEEQNNSNNNGEQAAEETLEVSGNSLLTTSNSNRHEEMNDSVESATQSSSIQRRISSTFNRRISTMLIEATLVEDSEIYEAKTMEFCQRYWKFIFAITVIILTISTLVGTLVIEPPFTKAPKTSSPTSSPTFDPRPTLDIVQERGYLLCGVNLITHFQFINICPPIAAVIFGNSSKYEHVEVTVATRFDQVKNRHIDLVLDVARTVEKEVMERSTGTNFHFTTPYYYDSVSFYGNETFVKCAEEQKRYDECASLRICALGGGDMEVYVKANFPPEFFFIMNATVQVSDEAMRNSSTASNCNVIAIPRLMLSSNDTIDSENYPDMIVGEVILTTIPMSTLTRGDDSEFSSVVELVVQSLFYGEEQGLTKDISRCESRIPIAGNVSDLNFMNAVYCVGSYRDVIGSVGEYSGMNQINNGSTGMLYPPRWGDLDKEPRYQSVIDHIYIDEIRRRGHLRCGVVTPIGYLGGNISENSVMIVGMSADYCRAFSAAIFYGKTDNVEFTTFVDGDGSAFNALSTSTIDVLAGVKVDLAYLFPTDSHGGFHFSEPFYYGDEGSYYSIAISNDNSFLYSFVDAIVLAPVYALTEGITRENSEQMPLALIFGNNVNWALRDAVQAIGNWNELYEKNFRSDAQLLDSARGRNALNDGGPKLHSFPLTNIDPLTKH